MTRSVLSESRSPKVVSRIQVLKGSEANSETEERSQVVMKPLHNSPACGDMCLHVVDFSLDGVMSVIGVMLSGMARQQLPPQIKTRSITDRRTGKLVRRYIVTIDVAEPGQKRKQVQRRFRTEREARAYLAETLAAVTSGTYVGPDGTTVRQVVDDFLDTRQVKASTLASYWDKLSALSDVYGDKRIQSLTEADVVRLLRRLRAGEVEGRTQWSARSANYLLGLIKAMLKSEVQQGRCVRNVAANIRSYEGDPKVLAKPLTEDDMLKVLGDNSRDRHIWTLAVYGLRRAEIAGLAWSDVDIANKRLTIRTNRVQVKKEVVAGSPKSRQSRRTLPLPDDVVTVLKSVRNAQRRERLQAGSCTKEAITSPATNWDGRIGPV